MKPQRLLALVLLPPFTLLTLYAVYAVGYVGIFTYHLHSPAGWQVFTDLVVALLLLLTWLIPEARRAGRAVWPWVLLTLLLGSLGPLLYLAFPGREREGQRVAT
ncbi:MAG: hypothetical protein AAGD86_09350 [Pseudomonadota bacterium]